MKNRWYLVFVILVLLLGACGNRATPTVTDEPTEEASDTPVVTDEPTEEASDTPPLEQHETVILIVDDFGAQFDAMSEQVLAEAGDILDEYIARFVDGTVDYDNIILPDDSFAYNNLAASISEEDPVKLSELLPTFLDDERITEIIAPILEENIYLILDTNPDEFSAASVEELNCAVNSEGQGIFVTGGTSIFVTGGTSVSSPGNTTFFSGGQGIFVTGGTGIFVTGGTGIFVTGGTVGVSNPSARPHGERVQEVADTLLAQHGAGSPIDVIPVHINGFLTANVAHAIQNAIEANGTEKNYVVNMSFAVIPCENMDSLLRYDALLRGISRQSDLDDQQLANSLDALLALTKLLTESDTYTSPPNPDDDFLGTMATLCEGDNCQTSPEDDAGQIVFVGAAGNGALHPDATGDYTSDFPYYPAAGDYVISISATEEDPDFDDNGRRAFWSNPGLILLPGVWGTGVMVDVTDPDGNLVTVEIVEVGTSFAAPRYSVLAALHLAGNTSTICSVDMQADFAVPPTDIWIPAPSAFDISVCP